MYKIIIKTFILTFVILVITGCGINKVYNVETKTFLEKPKDKSVYNAILESGKFLGWNMKQTSSDTIVAKIVLRNHIAKVKINFNENSYSIKLLEAQNLNYNKAENSIHKNYNGWIKNLENQINAKLTPLKMTPELEKAELMANSHKSNPLTTSKQKYKPIQNVINKKINKKYNSLKELEEKILKAGENVAWVMSKQKDGFILAKIVRRVHTAIVRINYNLESYSITYITSEKLGADEYYNIHNNYNIWIKELEEEISFTLQ